MPTTTSRSPKAPRSAARAGALLREWRAARRLSQLALALEAGVSARHLSCVETGKARPSREMVARLADTLGMPLRERNALLVAAGYAPEYTETRLDAPELAQVRRAIDLIVEHQEPYPAFVLNRRWDILRTNRAAMRVCGFFGTASRHDNMLRQFFDPDDVRAVVANWEEVAADLVRHLQEEIAAVPSDAGARALLDEVLRYPGVPSRWRTRELGAAPPHVLTVVFRKGGRELSFFSTITSFGTPRDVTLDELRIECTFPADDATAELCRALAREEHGRGAEAASMADGPRDP
ncbi:MAG TPA: helix-turn-helix transcriptional regulator [Gemmatimonadaceae bacterium]|nr:helix-turn-helix transcriptional regulator [Gemmatimonadaceae bacterium]